jgi:hypothetical protein
MPTLEEIKAQIEAIPDKYIFYTKKEINYLPEIMIEGEYVRHLTSGYFGKRTVLAVFTNRRVLLIDKGFFFGLRQWQIALDRIQSIDGEYLIAFGSIKIWDGAAATNLSMVWAKSIDPFIKEVRAAIDDYKRLSFQEVTGAAQRQQQDQQHYPQAAHHPQQHQAHQHHHTPAAQPQAQQVDIASQLERLAQLKEAGHLTEEEFQQQKQRLLSS